MVGLRGNRIRIFKSHAETWQWEDTWYFQEMKRR